MASIDSDQLNKLNKEISDLREEINLLRKILVPEISLPKEELLELDQIQKEMHAGNEFSLDSLEDDQ